MSLVGSRCSFSFRAPRRQMYTEKCGPGWLGHFFKGWKPLGVRLRNNVASEDRTHDLRINYETYALPTGLLPLWWMCFSSPIKLSSVPACLGFQENDKLGRDDSGNCFKHEPCPASGAKTGLRHHAFQDCIHKCAHAFPRGPLLTGVAHAV